MHAIHHDVRIPEELEGRRLDQALATLLPDYSRSRIKEWILTGRVRLDGAPAAPRTAVVAGQQVRLEVDVEQHSADRPEAIDLDVLYCDEALIVINKPAGLVVHPGAGNRAGTLVNGLINRWPELAALPRAGLLHRLDKDTSGLLVVARTLAAHTQLVRELQDRRITREYRAVCWGRMTAGGTVTAPIGRHPVHRTRMAVVARGRDAVTHYRVLRRFDAFTYLAVRLETGRTHQIRVHLAHIHHPLVGDRSYGGRLRLPPGTDDRLAQLLREFSRQALHASRLALAHPQTGSRLEFHAPLPRDLLALLMALAGPGTEPHEFDALRWPEPKSR
ncbi:MAG: 23S rRNA pseudouridine(1911/1915/1917) synthase RluD [Gammaproteobacteria bacterium]|nr:23S rRNA pseudouridine(1911/1915/1917) synthase RluD [Gammaproteobacteria bacterium]